ncbi:MAG: hypothetical protein EXR83_06190 [Gammaproteobacteria bacterium]|nr:hypothetical protein [Gammaproteobacteria bacterium]
MKLWLRKGGPCAAGTPAVTAAVRRVGGWVGPLVAAPNLPRDADVVSEEDLQVYAQALRRNGFCGPDPDYMNDAANATVGTGAPAVLSLPVLFLHARYDDVCETRHSQLADAIRARCPDLTERIIATGHGLAQEQPRAVHAALAQWLAARVASAGPAPASSP